MAVAVDGTEEDSVTSSGTVAISVPAATDDGDLLIAFNSQASDSASTEPEIDGAFTEIINQEQGSLGPEIRIGWKNASSEPASYDFTMDSNGVGSLIAISGQDSSTPINDSGSSTTSGTVEAKDAPSVTTTVDNCLVLYGISIRGKSISDFVSGPSGTSQEVIADRGGSGPMIAVYSKTQATAGSTGEGTFSWSGSQHASTFTVAVAPAAAAGIAPSVVIRHRKMLGMS